MPRKNSTVGRPRMLNLQLFALQIDGQYFKKTHRLYQIS